MNDINLILIGILAILGLTNIITTLFQGRDIWQLRQQVTAIGNQSDEMDEYLFGKQDVIINPDDSTGEWERLT